MSHPSRPENHPAPQGQPAPQAQPQGGYGQPGAVPPQQGGKYGTSAYSPDQDYQRDGTAPAKLGTYRKALTASAAMWVLSSLAGLLSLIGIRDTIQQQLERSGTALSGQQLDQAVAGGTIGAIVVVVISLLLALLYIPVFRGIRTRKSWTRTYGIVFAIVGIVASLAGLLMGQGGPLAIIGIIITVLYILANIWWLTAAFNGHVARWFDRR